MRDVLKRFSFGGDTEEDLDNASDFFIGHDAQNLEEGWIGAVDEVRAARRAWSDDWLRFSYLSQVPGSRLVSPYRQ